MLALQAAAVFLLSLQTGELDRMVLLPILIYAIATARR